MNPEPVVSDSASFGDVRIDILPIGLRFTRTGNVVRGPTRQWTITAADQLEQMLRNLGRSRQPDAENVRRAVAWAREALGDKFRDLIA